MKTENMLSELAIRLGIKKFILTALFLSISTNFLLGIGLAARTVVTQTTLVPPEIRRTLTVSNVAFSKEYLEEMAPYHAYLLLNSTPQSIDYNNEQLLKAVAPEYKDALEKELRVNSIWLKRENVSTYFSGVSAKADPDNNTVDLKGLFEVKQNNKVIYSKQRDLLITYRNTNGKIELLSIKEIYTQRTDVDEKKKELNAPQAASVTTETIDAVTTQSEFKGGNYDEKIK